MFPRTFEELRGKLADDTLVVVQGKVEEREEPGLILEQLLTIEEALLRFEGGLVVHVEPEDHELLPRLKQTLLAHKGPRPVYLTVRGRDANLVTTLSGNFSVSADGRRIDGDVKGKNDATANLVIRRDNAEMLFTNLLYNEGYTRLAL